MLYLYVMRSDKNKALKLRLQGRSYNEVTGLLGVPKSTLSDWFTGLQLPESARDRLAKRVYEGSVKALIKRNVNQTRLAELKARRIRKSSKKEVGKLSRTELFFIGTALYWAEGYKRPILKNGKVKTYHPVCLSNSDPALVGIYMRFLREVCQVPEERISAEVRIYQHQNEAYLLDFWSKITDLPHDRFKKFYYGVSLSSQHRRPFNILPYGTIQVRVNSTELYHKIMGWIEGLSKI